VLSADSLKHRTRQEPALGGVQLHQALLGGQDRELLTACFTHEVKGPNLQRNDS